MFASFQKKYFLSDKGVAGVKRGIFWTAITNLVTMAGMGFLFLTMACFVEHLTTGAALPAALPVVAGLVVFFVLLFASNWRQYYYTYCIFYEECGNQRIEIAERLRKLPLSFFGRRDLADLTETIMGDAQAMEHAYSHVLGELWGAVIASAIVFVGSLFFCWQLAVAAFWSVPVAFAVLYITRGPMTPVFDRVRAEKVKVTEAVQETLDCVREIRATNQEEHYLEGLAAVIDREEREVTRGELANGLLVNSAFAILRLGIATTLATGAAMVVSGQVDFMVMFAFLLMVSRIYAPFDQALMLVSELLAAESSAKRMRSIMRAQGSCVSTSCAYWARVSAFWGTKRRLAFVQVMSKAMFTPCDSRIRLISAFARAPAMPTLGIAGEKCVCGCRVQLTCGTATASSALRSEASRPSLNAAESAAWLRSWESICGAAGAASE